MNVKKALLLVGASIWLQTLAFAMEKPGNFKLFFDPGKIQNIIRTINSDKTEEEIIQKLEPLLTTDDGRRLNLNAGSSLPLMQACKRGLCSVVKLLVSHGADINKVVEKSNEFESPILIAIRERNKPLFDIILTLQPNFSVIFS